MNAAAAAGAPSAAARTSRPLLSVEAGRGLAALLVVLFHAGGVFAAPKYWNATVPGGFFGWGYAGVYFFFVLSGFIIVHVHAGDVGNPARLRRYALRRLIRIYPLYWLVLAGLLVLGPVVGDSGPPGLARIVSSLFLIGPDNQATVVAVAWTLYHEILFYLVFASWIVDRRLGLAVTAAWLGLIMAARFAALPLPAYVTSPVNLLFGYGAVTCWLARRQIPFAGSIALAAGLAFVAVGLDVVWWHHLPEPVREQLFGLAAAVGLAAVVSIERRGDVRVPKPLLLLGAASYAIYLVHFPLLSLLAKLSVRFGIVGTWPVAAAFMAVVALAVAGGIAVHRLIERPLLAAINARAFPRRDERTAWT